MSDRGSQQAYPHVCKVVQVHADGSIITQPLTQGGLTKRELFAAMAMQGMMANSDITKGWAESLIKGVAKAGNGISEIAVGQADALLCKLEEAK